MGWFQIALLVLQLLRQFKTALTAEEFITGVQASGVAPTANGDFLRWIWENREKVIEILRMLMELIPGYHVRELSAPATESIAEEAVLDEIKSLLAK
jgi:hypothetical protein